MKKLLFILFSFLAFGHFSHAQLRMSAKDMSFRLDEDHEFVVNEVAALDGNKVKAYVQFILNSGTVRISDYVFSYFLRKNYLDESEGVKVKVDSSNIADVGFRQYVFQIEIEKESDDHLLVFDVYDRIRNRQYFIDIPLVVGEWKRAPFLLMQEKKDVPYFGKYLPVNASVRPVHPFNDQVNFEISGLLDESAFPMPPFEDSQVEEPTPTPIDTLYGINNLEAFTFYNEGYFEIKSPQVDGAVLPLLVVDEYYPYYKEYEELVKPLVFISTNDEFQKLRASDFPRDAFEEFVNMSISANQRVSKGFIRNYYKRIRRSARFFTSDRKGWKTDRGMIYQIFGKPQQVLRNETTELWVYSSANGARVRYIFDKVPGNGYLHHRLVRGKRYRDNWMQAVTQWRSGRVNE